MRRPTCPSAPLYKRHGQLACPHQLTDITADSPVRTGLPRRGRFTREQLQLHLAIINFMADYFRPGTLGDIHLKYILLVHIIFVKEQFIFALVCNIVCRTIIHCNNKDHGDMARATIMMRYHLVQDLHMCMPPFLRPNLYQHDVVNSPDCAGLQHRGRFICLSRL